MSITQKDEARALDADERKLLEGTHHPAVQEVSDAELDRLIGLVRERRDRARDLAKQKRREIRGKGEPRGASPAARDEGSRLKEAILASAVRRLNAERERRRRMANQVSLAENARKALAMKQASASSPNPNTRHAHRGMKLAASEKRENLMRPMERGRQRKAAARSQAARDAR